MEAVLAIDLGTSGVKGILFAPEGRLLAEDSARYPTYQSGPAAEQNPEDWWAAACAVASRLASSTPKPPLAVVLSGQMTAAILIDVHGALGRALLAFDTRGESDLGELVPKGLVERLERLSGNIVDSYSMLAKLLWVKRREPIRYRSARQLFLGAHDFVTWRLTGIAVTDHTTASTTHMLNLDENAWAVDLISEVGLRTDWLPDLLAAEETAGTVTVEAARATGLRAGTPVFHGSGDVGTTTVGAGAGEPGWSYIYLGTSGWWALTRNDARADLDTGLMTMRHPDPSHFVHLGPMQTAAGNLDWLSREFGELEARVAGGRNGPHDRIGELAATVPPGAGGVLYLPYLAGERAPVRDPLARGVFIGISRRTTRGELYRAVLEGVAFGLRTIRDRINSQEERHGPPVALVGGGARSDFWPQLIADVLQEEIQVLADPGNVAARGAALIAGKSLGWYSGFRPGDELFPCEWLVRPRPELAERYDRLFEVFASLHPVLAPVFRELALARDAVT